MTDRTKTEPPRPVMSKLARKVLENNKSKYFDIWSKAREKAKKNRKWADDLRTH